MPRKSKLSSKMIGWLDMGIWPFSIMICVGHTHEEIVKHLKKIKADDWLAGINDEAVLINSGNNFALKRELENEKTGKRTNYFYIILREPFDFSDEHMIILAHESLHICQFALKIIFDMEREWEAVAYTHSYIMEKTLQKLRNKKG